MYKPLFNNFREVKDIMLNHSHIIAIIGILITIISGFQNSIDAPLFAVGVLITGIFALIMGLGRKHIQAAANKMMNK